MTNNQQHLPCPCGKSSDSYSIQSNGWGKCFTCGKNTPPDMNNDKPVPWVEDINDRIKKARELTPLTNIFSAYAARGITKATVEKFKVDVSQDENSPILARYPIYKDDKHVANKVRTKDKKFYYEGDPANSDLMGKNVFPSGGKYITIVEGQDDMLATFELMGSRYPVVSVQSSSSALADCKRNFEYLDSFDNIVVVMDNDAPGKEAAKKIAGMGFKLGKVKVLTLREYKDANDYLLNKKGELFNKEWWSAPTYRPDGIKIGKDMLPEILNRPNHFSVQYPFNGFNKMTYGMRLSEVVILTAETGRGKTTILKEIEYSLLMNEDLKEKGYGLGFLHLEEPNHDTCLGLMSIHNNKPYHLPDTERTEEELVNAFNAVINNDRVVIWDHFGSNSVDEVLSKVRYMHALGCKYIVLDHLSIIVSDQSGDERKQLDEISTKLKTLCMELNIAVLAVIHQNRQGQIRGTAGVEQLANVVMKIERDIKSSDEWRRNVTKVTIEKNRFSGRTGPCCYLWYNEATNRLVELEEDEINRYEAGEGMAGGISPF